MRKAIIVVASILFSLLAHSQETDVKTPPAAATPARPAKPKCSHGQPPEMPKAALQKGISGTVVAEILITPGEANQVTILSGPPVYHASVRASMMSITCPGLTEPYRGTQEFKFKIEG